MGRHIYPHICPERLECYQPRLHTYTPVGANVNVILQRSMQRHMLHALLASITNVMRVQGKRTTPWEARPRSARLAAGLTASQGLWAHSAQTEAIHSGFLHERCNSVSVSHTFTKPYCGMANAAWHEFLKAIPCPSFWNTRPVALQTHVQYSVATLRVPEIVALQAEQLQLCVEPKWLTCPADTE